MYMIFLNDKDSLDSFPSVFVLSFERKSGLSHFIPSRHYMILNNFSSYWNHSSVLMSQVFLKTSKA